ncbi:MAG: bacterio-opsin activator domain-containing protein [Halobacteriota archaeon]
MTEGSDQAALRLLVVAEDDAIADLVTRLSEVDGRVFEVSTAASTTDAVTVLKELDAAVDCILIEYGTVETDDAQLMSSGRGNRIPCLFLLDDETDPLTVEVIRDGTFDYVETRCASAYPSSLSHRVRQVVERAESTPTQSMGETYLQTVLDTIDDVFFLLSPEGEPLNWNRRANEITGYSDAEMTSMTMTDFVVEADHARMVDAAAEVLETGHAEFEATVRTKDGREIPFEYRSTKLTDAKGNDIGICGIGRDVSERVARERTLQERERTLERQTEQLADLDRMNRVIRSVQRGLVRAKHRTEVERLVCDQLVDTGQYEFVWMSRWNAVAEVLSPAAWAGRDRTFVDSLLAGSPHVTDSETIPALKAIDANEPLVFPAIGELDRHDRWRTLASETGFRSAAVLPLSLGDSDMGVVEVYSTRSDAFPHDELTVLAELTETIADSIKSVGHQEALVSTNAVEVTVEVKTNGSLWSTIAREVGCTLSVDSISPREDGTWDVFYRVGDAHVEAVVECAKRIPGVVDAEVTHSVNGDELAHLVRPRLPAAETIAEQNGQLQSAEFGTETGRLTFTLPQSESVRAVHEALLSLYPSVELRRQRRRWAVRDPKENVSEELTPRQRECIELAFDRGYYESPRTASGSELAAEIGISPPTFHDHLRKGTQKVFAALLDETE